MNAVDHSIRAGRNEIAHHFGRTLISGVILLLLAVSITGVLYRYPPSLTAALVVGLGLVGVLALAIVRYEIAVAIGFFLIGVVVVEPAPPDAIFSVVIAVALVTGRFEIRRVPLAVVGLISAFLVLNLISAIEAVDPAIAARFFMITLYLAVFSVWFTGYLDSIRRTRTVVLAYVASALLSSLLGLLALFMIIPGQDLLLLDGCCRIEALFEDPNVFGPFLVPAALILLEEVLNPRLIRARRATKILIFLTLALGIFFSYSRAAWLNFALALVVMLVVIILRRGGGRQATTILGIVIAGATVALSVIAISGSFEFIQERATFQTYDVERFGAQLTGVELAEQYPIGIGPGQFEVLVPVATHSTYVRALAEQGLLGLIVILSLMILTLALAARNAFAGRDTYGIGSAALLGAWFGILANSLFVDTLHWRHLWFVAALIWVGAMRQKLKD